MATGPIPSISDPSPPTPTLPSELQHETKATIRKTEVELDDDQHDNNTLSPLRDSFPRSSYASPRVGRPSRSSLSPQSQRNGAPKFQLSENALHGAGNGSPVRAQENGSINPFNFQTQEYNSGRPVPMSPSRQTEFGRRRGHRYARSSISHQIILEPTPRSTPLQLPASLPIPTFREFRTSMTREQTLRGLWCLGHLLVASFIQFNAHGSLAMTALSHLLFFDTLGAFLCVAVDIGRNFEVWGRSTIRHPFGLERAEVLAGLATAIILLFMGCDLISHGLTHTLENKGGHESHHSHKHERVSPGSIDTAALAAILSTLISAFSLGNHARIGRSLQLSFPDWLPQFLRNPSHLLTLSCSGLLLLLPLLSMKIYNWFDVGLAFTMAFAMILLGGRLCFALGRMLLMSFPGPAASSVQPPNSSLADPNSITTVSPHQTQSSLLTSPAQRSPNTLSNLLSGLLSLPGIASITDVKIWQVHYGLCVAAFKMHVVDTFDPDVVRERAVSVAKARLQGTFGEGKGAIKWEISIMCASVGSKANGNAATTFGGSLLQHS